VQRLSRWKEVGRRRRKMRATWLCGDEERSCEGLQSLWRRYSTGSSARKRSVFHTPS